MFHAIVTKILTENRMDSTARLSNSYKDQT